MSQNHVKNGNKQSKAKDVSKPRDQFEGAFRPDSFSHHDQVLDTGSRMKSDLGPNFGKQSRHKNQSLHQLDTSYDENTVTSKALMPRLKEQKKRRGVGSRE